MHELNGWQLKDDADNVNAFYEQKIQDLNNQIVRLETRLQNNVKNASTEKSTCFIL